MTSSRPGLLRHFVPGVKSYADTFTVRSRKAAANARLRATPKTRAPATGRHVPEQSSYADAGPTPFIGQVARVLPGSATAEIALIKRPAAKAKPLPYYQLQNLAAEACGLVFLPLDDLKLRSRAARPVHPISEPPLRETSPAKFAHNAPDSPSFRVKY